MQGEIRVGAILRDTTKQQLYRIIYVSAETMVLCQIGASSLSLTEHLTTVILNLVRQKVFLVEQDTPTIFVAESLSPNIREAYETKLNMMNEVSRIYGPTYMRLSGKAPKPELKEILQRYGVAKTVFWRAINKYLQSGMQNVSLVDSKAFGLNAGKEYEYTKKPGRQSNSITASHVVLNDEIKQHFAEALAYYKKSRNITIQAAFDEMNNLHYTKVEIVNGVPTPILYPPATRPSYKQFYNYFQTHLTEQEKDLIKTSAREQRNNKRLLTSDSLFDVHGPGDVVEIDACEADISLVSMLDKNQTVGRPIVYFMIDVYSRIILAVSIAFDNNSIVGLTNLFLNLADDKKAYCQRFGMDFDNPALWPSNIIPNKVRVDHGAEFKGKEFERICKELNIERNLVPVATGSMKGIVEQSFRQLHLKQNPHLGKCGLIEKRYDSKHHVEATLNIQQYTQMVIAFILSHNQQCLTGYPLTKDMIEKKQQPVPYLLWEYGTKQYGAPRPITNYQQFVFNLMVPVKAKLSKKGICYKNLWYLPSTMEDPFLSREMFDAGTKKVPFEVRIDPRDVGHVYYIRKGKLIKAPLNERLNGNIDYKNLTFKQYEDYQKAAKELLADGKIRNQELSAATHAINEIIVNDAKKPGLSSKKGMRAARDNEKQIVAKTNRIAPKLDTPLLDDPEEIPMIESPIQTEMIPEKPVLETWDDVFNVDWD